MRCCNRGWKFESARHSLAAKHVKTGRKALGASGHTAQGFIDVAPFPIVSAREFFVRRFEREPEEDLQYFREWQERFATGNPEAFMDSQSLMVYKTLKKEKQGLLAKGKVERKDLLPGGLADKADYSKFDQEQLSMGQKVEREHTSDKRIATEIAGDHLMESRDYYTRLGAIEKAMKKSLGAKGKSRLVDPSKFRFGSVDWQDAMVHNIVLKGSKKEPLNDYEKTFVEIQLAR